MNTRPLGRIVCPAQNSSRGYVMRASRREPVRWFQVQTYDVWSEAAGPSTYWNISTSPVCVNVAWMAMPPSSKGSDHWPTVAGSGIADTAPESGCAGVVKQTVAVIAATAASTACLLD